MNHGVGRGKNPWNKNFQQGDQNQESKKAEGRFRNAQEKLQANIQKHLENDYESSSSDEENLEADSILKSVLKNYSALNGQGDGLGRTQQFLESAFQSGAGICLICIASVKRADAIWNCLECFGYFHLVCIQKWSRDSLFHLKQSQEDLPVFQRKVKITWACPKCRHDYDKEEVPQRYFCFCGRVENPPVHPWLVPHSCGETCNKYLQPACGHQCLLLCHPGPCPPCPKTVKINCHCGKQGPKPQRCSDKFWSCNAKCGKSLLCKKHKCEEICHAGDCPSCGEESVQKCKCGSKQRKQPCTTPVWQCDKVCGKPFSCGFHKCEEVCHEGDCGDCPKSLSRTCPCGKSQSTLPCTQEVPTCNDTCEKLLECGRHNCSQKCHKDKCGACLEIVTKVCRCGFHKKELPCQKEFLCETKCRRMKNCFRHTCNRKCCDMVCPPCEKPCGKTLTCGNHKCPSVCHRGQCYPCPQTAQVKCRCGGTFITVPCGRQKKTKPPKCNKSCMIPPDCHHPSRQPHRCHFGECPRCDQICGIERKTCEHKCSASCHTAVWIKIQNDHRPAGPWEKVEPQLKKCKLPCPDCEVAVPVTCLGGHDTSYYPCHKAKPSSCFRPCGRLLKCGNHTCTKECHIVTESENTFLAGKECLVCDSECTRERPPRCTHRCPMSCHPDPCPPCTMNVKLKCHCGISTLYRRCDEHSKATKEVKEAMLCCGNECPKNYSCGHRCKANCHSGDCPNPEQCKEKVKILCNCGRIKKTFTCDVIRKKNITNIDCDDVCLQKKEEEEKAKELLLEKKKLEEERKNKEELEKFEKKFRPKKKQRERFRAVEEDQRSFLSRYWPSIIAFIAGVSATIYYFTRDGGLKP